MISLNLLPDVKKDLLKVRRERNLVMMVSIVAVIGSLAVLGLLFLWMGALTGLKMLDENKINDAKAKIETAKEDEQLDKYLTIQNQLAQIDGLKGGQLIHSRLMDFLVQLNPAEPNNVFLRSVRLTADGEGESADMSVEIEGTTDNFASLDVYKNTLISAKLIYENKPEDEVDSTDTTTSDESSSAGAESSDSEDDSSSSESTAVAEATSEMLFNEVSVLDSNLSSDGVNFSISAVFNTTAFSPNITNIKIEIPREITSDGDRNAPLFNQTEDEESNDGTDVTTSEGGAE